MGRCRLLALGWSGLALAGCPVPAPPPPNILLVSMDTTRADHLSTYGYARDTSPNLSELAARGTLFESSFSQGNESLYSHATLLTGRYPSEVSAPNYTEYLLPPDAVLLSEILELYGYDTAAFTAGGHLVPVFGFDQGFDTFETSPGLGFGSFFDTVPLAIAWIGSRTSLTPWFAFVHSYDAHAPYVRPDPFYHLYDAQSATARVEALVTDPLAVELVHGRTWYRDRTPADIRHKNGRQILAPATYEALGTLATDERVEELGDEEIEHLVSHYDSGVAYADMFLGELLGTLEEAGALSNTLVIVLSDHGEDLLDHGFVNHRTALTDSTTHVPLVLSGPGFEAGVREEGLVEARDILPTVLRAAGAVIPAGLGGRALQDTRREPPIAAVFQEGVMDMVSVRTEDWRLVYHSAPLANSDYDEILEKVPIDPAHFTLYHTAEDPAERVDCTSTDPGVAEELRGQLLAWRKTLHRGNAELGREDVSPVVRAMLEARGYWEFGQP